MERDRGRAQRDRRRSWPPRSSSWEPLSDDEVAEALAAAGAELGRCAACSTPIRWRCGSGGRVDTARLEPAAQAGRRGGGAGRRASPGCARTRSGGSPRPRRRSRRRRPPARTPRPPGSGPPRRSPPPACRRRRRRSAGLDARLAALDALRAAGRWARLAAELDTIEAEAAAAEQRCREARAGGRRRSWAGAMNCAACWTPTRPRRPGWGQPRTPSSTRRYHAGPGSAVDRAV